MITEENILYSDHEEEYAIHIKEKALMLSQLTKSYVPYSK